MNLKKKISILLIFFAVLGSSSAHAFYFTPVVGYAMTTALFNPTLGFDLGYRTPYYGAGALFGFGMFKKVYTELGLLYMPRGWEEVSSSTTTKYEFNSLQIPLLLRIYALPSISIGLGGYFSYGIGSITISDSASSNATTSSFGSSSLIEQVDTGMIACVGLKLPIFRSMSLIVDARYLLGVQNISQVNGVGIYLRDLQVFGGLQLGK